MIAFSLKSFINYNDSQRREYLHTKCKDCRNSFSTLSKKVKGIIISMILILIGTTLKILENI